MCCSTSAGLLAQSTRYACVFLCSTLSERSRTWSSPMFLSVPGRSWTFQDVPRHSWTLQDVPGRPGAFQDFLGQNRFVQIDSVQFNSIQSHVRCVFSMKSRSLQWCSARFSSQLIHKYLFSTNSRSPPVGCYVTSTRDRPQIDTRSTLDRPYIEDIEPI